MKIITIFMKTLDFKDIQSFFPRLSFQALFLKVSKHYVFYIKFCAVECLV
jgi:hypothetical protein